MRRFNTTGLCVPEKHYMVDISERILQIREMIEKGCYFCINRGRQYGKTTTLRALRVALTDEYDVVSLDFQAMSEASFRSEGRFVLSMAKLICEFRDWQISNIPDEIADLFAKLSEEEEDRLVLADLFSVFEKWCRTSEKPVVLMIDEVDSATNNQVFLDFLAGLRLGYLERDASDFPAFRSVILAGVTDIKHLRSKLRDEDQHKVNSPWNIAVDFTVDMSLSADGIAGMLVDYERDHNIGMDCGCVGKLIREYTGGYPFLVSRICQIIDESPDVEWNRDGVERAVRAILREDNTLFDSLMGKLTNSPELKNMLRRILFQGESVSLSPDNEGQKLLRMYGFIYENNGKIEVSNRIFETRLYNYYLEEPDENEGNEVSKEGDLGKSLFIKDGGLDVPLILEHFIDTYTQVFGPLEDRFLEKDGREYFLLYLKPIINGTGNYYIEAQTRDQTRTDVVVDYLGHQYVIELKIWRGKKYNEDGEKQVSEYLDYFGLDTGYMLIFNFNKKKEPGVRKVTVGDKTVYEGML